MNSGVRARDRRSGLYEEFTPPPSERNAWELIVTYAGLDR